MFEEKKDKAQKTMSKKDKKMEEIKEVSSRTRKPPHKADRFRLLQLLREEIAPKLEKYREEKRSWLEYQKAQSELEKLGRRVAAYDWITANQKCVQRRTCKREGS